MSTPVDLVRKAKLEVRFHFHYHHYALDHAARYLPLCYIRSTKFVIPFAPPFLVSAMHLHSPTSFPPIPSAQHAQCVQTDVPFYYPPSPSFAMKSPTLVSHLTPRPKSRKALTGGHHLPLCQGFNPGVPYIALTFSSDNLELSKRKK